MSSLDHPNILLFISDHLSPRVIGAYGEMYSCTPNIDDIAARGSRFDSVYATCPLCMPSRASFWTGRLPHETNVLSNGRKHSNGPLPKEIITVGDLFSAGGYEAVHFGKKHDFGTLRGFRCFPCEPEESEYTPHPAWPENNDTYLDNDTTRKCIQWLRQHHDRPFLAVADLNNPHNICGWTGANSSMDALTVNIAPPVALPSLPDNHNVEDMADRPLPVQYICCSHNRLGQAARWTPENYRHYLAAYCHYTKMVDAQIGAVMQELAANGLMDDTVIIVISDHGDGMASHGMVTKQVSFYDETTRVPFITAGPDIPAAGSIGDHPLVSLLDLLPTLCDIAGLEAPPTAGRSVMPLIHGESRQHHPYVVSEWHTEWGFTVSPGRMLRTPRYKYTRYLEGSGEELYDMLDDPGEQRNLAPLEAYRDVLQQQRDLLAQHVEDSADPFWTLDVKVDEKWRSHAPGYANHRGPTAPMYGE